MSANINYRPDVDGLRAVAVLGVVLFHLDPAWLPGGFIGVDIFFVISGFLITSILAREMAAGAFGFGKFYRRRILRIAPAYFVVTVVTLVAGAFLLLPADLAELSRSALWSAVSLPNVYFWAFLDTGYFAAESEEMPLLHLWSLGVEEQFYLLWPAALVLLGRLRERKAVMLPLLGALAVLSFWHGQATATSDPSYSYYMLPTRAGELLSGALVALAFAGDVRGRDGGWTWELLAWAGVGLIAAGFVVLDGRSLFPGWNALYPCVGTALVIWAGCRRDGYAAKLLSLKPMLWIGLVSYSLYLWHWPVLAFMRYFLGELDGTMLAVAAASMGGLAWLSYRWVEVPFRSMRTGATGWRVPVVYASLVGALALGAGALVHSRGMETMVAGSGEFRAAEERLEQYTKPAFRFPYQCQDDEYDPGHLDRPQCVVGEGEPKVLLFGDSNATHYVGMLGAFAEKGGFAFRNAQVGSCPPVFGGGEKYGAAKNAAECAQFRALVESRMDDYEVFVLGGQWMSNLDKPDFRKEFRRTVRLLARRGRSVVLLGQVPLFPSYDRACEMRRLRLPTIDCERQARRGARPDLKANVFLRKVASQVPRVHYIEIRDVLCGERCSPYLDGVPVYYDPSHLSMDGSWRIGRQLVAGLPGRPTLLEIVAALERPVAEPPAAATAPAR